MTNEPIIICNVILRAWSVCHRHYLERMKTFLFGFVFVRLSHKTNGTFCFRHGTCHINCKVCKIGEFLFITLDIMGASKGGGTKKKPLKQAQTMECVTTAADAVGSAAGGAPAVLLNTYKSFFLQGKRDFISYYTFLTETCRCSLSGLQQNVSAFFASIKMAVSV